MVKSTMSKGSKKIVYKTMDQLTHVLKRPDIYIGSVKNTEMEHYSAKKEESGEIKIQQKTGPINPGLHRIFVEIISNAVDNVWRSDSTDTPCTKIKVKISDDGEISVWNDGTTIHIEVNEETGLYNPEMIFGRLLSGSNFNDEEERKTSGRNGIGSKATNIFSTEFTVETFDPPSGKKYVQTWKNNMSEKDKPKITSPKLKSGYTQVSFRPDYAKFGVSGLSREMLGLMFKNVVDTAMITGVSVYLNDEKIPVKSLTDYAMMYSEEDADYILLETSDTQGVLTESSPDIGGYKPVAFVNGIETYDGGNQVDTWSEALLRPILEKINKGVKKGNKPLTIKDIRPYFRLFLNSKLTNPTFTSQEKTKLSGPDVAVPELSAKNLTAIMKWPVISEIKEILESKDLAALKKVEKKRGFKKIEGLDPANLAGGKYSSECSLIICEGDSAKTFAVSGLSTGVFGKKGRDYTGVWPAKGKLMNVRGKSGEVIQKNREITDLIQALNLRIDADYTTEKDFKTLSYGRVILICDSDVDGHHISGLIINFFHYLFPTLLQRDTPFITSMRTPIVRIRLPKNISLEFYTLRDYHKYAEQHPGQKAEVKYFKGLGTNKNDEIASVFGKKMIEFVKDNEADQNLNKVFNSKTADKRKEWIEQYDPENVQEIVSKDPVQTLSISDFLNNEMILFSIDDCGRSIPNIMDGFKESHRKIYHTVANIKKLKYSGKEMKVAQLAGAVAEKTGYHHGESILYDTITKMAQDYVGANNIPLLYRGGQFGSRCLGGNDAASGRYIFTKLDVMAKYLFRQEDNCILTYMVEEGDKIEPEFFVPVLPMVLVNRTLAGIGTGWSSSIPGYNPLDLVECIKAWINNECYLNDETDEKEIKAYVFPEISPWYRGFLGTIEKVDKTKYVSKGVLTTKNSTTVIVSELPVGMNTDKFKEFCDDLLEAKKIKSYKNYSTDTKVEFHIQESDDGIELSVEGLKLTTNLNTSNMVLFNEKRVIKKYDNVDEILENFCIVRYSYYVKRKDCIIVRLELEQKILANKMKFLKEVISGDLEIKEVDEETLAKNMKHYFAYVEEEDEKVSEDEEEEESSKKKKKVIPEDGLKNYRYLLGMNIRSFTKQKIENLQKELDKITKELKLIRSTTPAEMWMTDLNEFETEYKKNY